MSRLTLAFLGAFQANLDQQPLTGFRSVNNQGMLAYLALHPDKAVPREVLATLFWPEETEQTARRNLRQALYQLRTLFGENGQTAQPFLLVDRQTAQFNSASDYTLDVQEFLGAIEVNDLETAVGIYQNELLPGFTCDSPGFEDWLRLEREGLHHLALEAMAEVTADHLRAGELDKAQATARRQLSLEPWREGAHRQLMQAYALAGDRGNALAQYESCRTQLWTELGLEPASETTALFEEIKAGLYGPLETDKAIRPPVKTRHNLPADTTPFIGREVELAQIGRLLSQNGQRLVSIVGPGGMGKTRLAVTVGSNLLKRYRDGVYLVDLTPLNEVEEIGPAIAAALNYQAPDQSQALWPQLLATLSQRQLLLILDNFEHLMAGTTLINDLLVACPEVAIIVTTRQRLNMASENRYELGGLAYPDSAPPEEALGYTAVQLFADSGRRTRSDFKVTENNVVATLRICQLVQGMPLGLLLAAAWLELLTPAEIAAEIEESLEFLAADLGDLPPRQRSMQAVFERSWGLMSATEQAVMADLSVFRGGFTREAAEQVAGANLRILLSLVNKSLLQRQAGGGRFTVQELLRQFAAAKRRQADPSNRASLAHCRYFARLMADEVRRAQGYYPVHVPRQFGADRGNFRRAWEYALEQGLAGEVAGMARGMAIFNFAQGIPAAEIPEQAIQALQERGVPNTDRNMLQLRLMAIIVLKGYEDHNVVRQLFQEFVSEIESGDPELRYWTYQHWGLLEYVECNPESLTWIEMAYQAALDAEDESFIKMAEAHTLCNRVNLRAQDETTLAQLQEMLAYFELEYPNSIIVYELLWSLGDYCASIGAYDQAITYGKRCLNIAKGWQDLFWISRAADILAYVYEQMGALDQASKQNLDVLEWHLAIGQVWQTLGYLWGKASDFPRMFGGDEAVVSLLAMVYHHPEVNRHYQQKINEVRPQFEAALGVERYAAAWERGKSLDFEVAVAQARAALASAGEMREETASSPGRKAASLF